MNRWPVKYQLEPINMCGITEGVYRLRAYAFRLYELVDRLEGMSLSHISKAVSDQKRGWVSLSHSPKQRILLVQEEQVDLFNRNKRLRIKISDEESDFLVIEPTDRNIAFLVNDEFPRRYTQRKTCARINGEDYFLCYPFVIGSFEILDYSKKDSGLKEEDRNPRGVLRERLLRHHGYDNMITIVDYLTEEGAPFEDLTPIKTRERLDRFFEGAKIDSRVSKSIMYLTCSDPVDQELLRKINQNA